MARPVRGLAERWWVVDGRPVRGFVAGPTGPLVVLLPGLGAPAYLRRWAVRTSAWARVVLLDLPGWSARGPGRAATVAGVASLARRWLDAVDASDVVLVGHSTGALAALLLAADDPVRLRSLFLAGVVFDPPARRLPTLALRCLLSLTPRLLPEVPAMTPALVRAGLPDLTRLVRSALAFRAEDVLPRVRVPTTLAVGRRDRLGRASWVLGLADRDDRPVHVLPGRHNVVFTDPGAVDDALRSSLPGPDGGVPVGR